MSEQTAQAEEAQESGWAEAEADGPVLLSCEKPVSALLAESAP